MNTRFNHQLGTYISPIQERAIQEAYWTLYEFLGARKEDHLIFTSSGAESVNHAIFSAYIDITRKTGKNHFLCSSLDEAPAIMAMSRLRECGCLFQMIPATGDGLITKSGVAEMITPRTAMLSVSWAGALTGVIQPVLEIAELCRERDILFHIDVTHVLGRGDFSVAQTGADLVSVNGPIGGTGLLLIRGEKESSPFILGGLQQGGMRGGNFHVAVLIEFANWAKEQMAHKDHYSMEIVRLKLQFEEMVLQNVPGAKVLFKTQYRLPHITSFLFPGVASDCLYYALRQKGIHATFGGGDFQHFSHILKACGIQEPDAHCGMSFSLSHVMQEEEMIQGVQEMIATLLHVQRYSQYLWGQK